MTKRTKKAGIVGIRFKKMEVSQHSKYFCKFCGKVNLFAALFATALLVTVSNPVRRPREQTES
ncbi:hypothetical protein ACJRO7_020096 [Eucalyptus globulus]|uniref:Uncharacterized protein n=1 Tax=Eucalyptus globulus TaxID=34317 RepID=A0ABD3KH56_EUCGL